MASDSRRVSLCAVAQALLVRFVYAINGIVLTFLVVEIVNEPRVFVINALIIPSVIESVITLKFKRIGEWTWFIPSVFIYLLWMVPCIILLEIYALNFRSHVISVTGLASCPIVFYDECRSMMELMVDGEGDTTDLYGTNVTDDILTPESHDQARRYSMLTQQIMMLVIIFGRWMAPKGKLSRDQLSSLLLALTAMTLDMLEFLTDSLSINAVACDRIYVGFIIAVWCWSLLQIPLGLTAVKQRKPRVTGTIESSDSADGPSDEDASKKPCFNLKAYCCCCCESEIWSMMVSIFMQDGPYLILRLYIMFSSGYIGETLIFFAAKNAIIVALLLYRVFIKTAQMVRKKSDHDEGGEEAPGRIDNAIRANSVQVVISDDSGVSQNSSSEADSTNEQEDVEAQVETQGQV